MLFIEPSDVWLFRDGRPFNIGSGQRVQSLFPPFPNVVQGAIRSHQLALKKVNLHDKDSIVAAVGTSEDYGQLRLRGPFLARVEKDTAGKETIVPYFPLPMDAVVKNGEVRPASAPRQASEVKTSLGENLWIMGLDDQPEKIKGNLWLSCTQLLQYLDGKAVRIASTATSEKHFFTRENRIGNSIDSSLGITQTGMLFEVEYIRPEKGVGLLVEMSGYDDWPSSGIFRFGGESRSASFRKVNVSFEMGKVQDRKLPKRFKIYFASPTWFSAGWRPENWNIFFEGSVKLVSAAVGRYQSIGGFDYAKQWHKPCRRFVPAGSVYYFETTGAASIRQDLIQNALTEWGAEIGFGQYFITSKEW
ncbi:MAG TPA: type III-B CRISPR module-associated protein Cmr3 [Anaerolineaceae bacterium]|nr:type III-B CRISPR module-associated protein Cmr3 [Anaerolineaceae bacterium]HPN53855.1 type III-B CRISPR module-associated protein Cmr3 [Anaerolineaceae bacterium]